MLKTVGNPSTRYGDQTIVDGNLVIGTTGKGIDFSADPSAAGMTSELLDDYEEGDWTPVVTSTSGTITSFTASGTYTKIGRLVTVVARFSITNVGSGSGGILIDSLPFAATSRTAGTGRDNGASGKQVSVSGGGSGRLFVVNYDNTFPVTTGSEVDLVAQFYA